MRKENEQLKEDVKTLLKIAEELPKLEKIHKNPQSPASFVPPRSQPLPPIQEENQGSQEELQEAEDYERPLSE